MSNSRPIDTHKSGRVRASIWQEGKSGDDGEKIWYTVKFSRSYEQEGKWHYTDGFSMRDLAEVIALAQEIRRTYHLKSISTTSSHQDEDA